MVDDELAELRRRKLEQLQRQTMDQQSMEEELANQKEMESQIRMILMQVLEPEARERLNTIKLTRPDFAKAVEQQLVMLAQNGRIKHKINDQQLKELLKQIIPSKKEYTIRRK
jgi:programmed cell death protein 5